MGEKSSEQGQNPAKRVGGNVETRTETETPPQSAERGQTRTGGGVEVRSADDEADASSPSHARRSEDRR